MKLLSIFLFFCFFITGCCGVKSDCDCCYVIEVPALEKTPVIDGNLADWKYFAFCDGDWDIYRIRQSLWYDSKINRLTDHGQEDFEMEDLRGRYYMAWKGDYLYMGAEVHDNFNDINDPEPNKDRWYFKDAVCWYIEAPKDEVSESFEVGDNAYCFVIDDNKPSKGALWRRNNRDGRYFEQEFPDGAMEYEIKMNPWGKSEADFVIEARVNMSATLGDDNPEFKSVKEGDVFGLMIVHTDPDGGGYGGHFLLYGSGDDDLTWGKMVLVKPLDEIERKKE